MLASVSLREGLERPTLISCIARSGDKPSYPQYGAELFWILLDSGFDAQVYSLESRW